MNESQQGALAVIGIIITIIVAAILTVHILTPTEIQDITNQNETKVGGSQTVETNPFNNETNNTVDNNSIIINDLNLNVSNATTQ